MGIMKLAYQAFADGMTRLGNLWLASVVFIHTGIDVTKQEIRTPQVGNCQATWKRPARHRAATIAKLS